MGNPPDSLKNFDSKSNFDAKFKHDSRSNHDSRSKNQDSNFDRNSSRHSKNSKNTFDSYYSETQKPQEKGWGPIGEMPAPSASWDAMHKSPMDVNKSSNQPKVRV